jgi:hypothetical protein
MKIQKIQTLPFGRTQHRAFKSANEDTKYDMLAIEIMGTGNWLLNFKRRLAQYLQS